MKTARNFIRFIGLTIVFLGLSLLMRFWGSTAQADAPAGGTTGGGTGTIDAGGDSGPSGGDAPGSSCSCTGGGEGAF